MLKKIKKGEFISDKLFKESLTSFSEDFVTSDERWIHIYQIMNKNNKKVLTLPDGKKSCIYDLNSLVLTHHISPSFLFSDPYNELVLHFDKRYKNPKTIVTRILGDPYIKNLRKDIKKYFTEQSLDFIFN
jgi:hypothetical protein